MYQTRPMICRLFGFAAVRAKVGPYLPPPLCLFFASSTPHPWRSAAASLDNATAAAAMWFTGDIPS